MSDSLVTYLHDHRAGATGAIELLEALTERREPEGLALFAAGILGKVRADVAVLDRLIEVVGAPNALKEAAAWVAQKVTHFKLPGHGHDPLGAFQALEALVVGISGKRALWEVLARVSRDDRRLAGVDYAALGRGAQEQLDLVNARRLQMAPEALRRTDQPPS